MNTNKFNDNKFFTKLSMDFWASMEHRICYKKEYDEKDKVSREMQQYAMALEFIESRFEQQLNNTQMRLTDKK